LKLSTQRRLAARILGIGVNRVWIDPTKITDVSTAITSDDVKQLIHDGTIKARPERGVSRARARVRIGQRKRGRRRGVGSRRGTARARKPKKVAWIRTVRPLRLMLQELRDKEVIERREYRRLYRMVKGGSFRSKAHLQTYLKEKGLLRG
jgi:large subunit ribosomal protein L19e